MTNVQTRWTERELLASHPTTAPVFAGAKRCHGGFDDNGAYVSPRTLGRWPAIHNWQAAHRDAFGTEILDAPLDQWPANYPSVEQSKFLLRNGITEPTAATLTRIGTVEGFGGLIREVGVADLQRHFVDSIDGTALAHLDLGLFEAHARDEVGFEDVAGHKEMWFAARDIAFDRAYAPEEVQAMLDRMNLAATPANPPQPVRLCPEIAVELESMFRFMIGLMFIEVAAFHAFAWAFDVLSDSELVAGDGAAADLITYIRADEAPHIAYLQTALTETRDRTLRGERGSVSGAEMIQRMWDHSLAESLGPRHQLGRAATNSMLDLAFERRSDGADLRAEFESLGGRA